MKFTTTLIRRTVVSLSAIAALIVTGYAASQTVELRSGTTVTASCSYSSMTVSPNGGVVVACGATAGPGTFTISGPASLALNSTTTGTTVKISRTGGSTGAVDVAVSVAGTSTSACSVTTPSPINFADGDSTAKGLIVDAGSSGGTCVLTIAPSAGTAAGTGSLPMTVVDPNDPVTFSFAQVGSNAQVGQGPDVIVVTRTGGTGGQWTVPVTFDTAPTVLNNLAASSTTLITNGGTMNPSNLTLVFPAGGASQTIQYQPSTTMPAGTTLRMVLGTPVGPVPASAQTASLGANTAHTVSLSGPAVGCPAFSGTPKSLGGAGTVNHNNVTSGTITVYNLPTASTGVGQVNLYSNPSTPKFGPTTTEISISKCQGDFSNNADGCYQAVDALDGTQINQEWALNYNARYPNAAAFVRQKRCLTPAGSSYYVNIRVTFPPGACGSNTCGWDPIWRALSTFL